MTLAYRPLRTMLSLALCIVATCALQVYGYGLTVEQTLWWFGAKIAALCTPGSLSTAGWVAAFLLFAARVEDDGGEE